MIVYKAHPSLTAALAAHAPVPNSAFRPAMDASVKIDRIYGWLKRRYPSNQDRGHQYEFYRRLKRLCRRYWDPDHVVEAVLVLIEECRNDVYRVGGFDRIYRELRKLFHEIELRQALFSEPRRSLFTGRPLSSDSPFTTFS